MATRKKVINTPFLLTGTATLIPDNPPPSNPLLPPENAGDIPHIDDVTIPAGYVRTYQGWPFTIDAWSPYTKDIPTQIFLHHTAGHQRGDRSKGTINFWNKRNGPNFTTPTKKNPTGRSYGSTTCVIDKNGILERCVPENRKAHSEGVKNSQWSLSVELMGLGYFTNFDDTKQQWYRGNLYCPKGEEGTPVAFNGTPLLAGYRGYKIYQKYPKAMVDTTIQLIKEWCYRYSIKFIFNQEAYNDMFPSTKQTPLLKKNTMGVFSHNSVKEGSSKTDVYPDPYLIQQLKQHFGRSDNFNGTVSGYDPSAKLPRTVPPWNPTKMEIGNFKGGWSQKKDKIKIPQEFPNHKY
jgi:hypothetical protein